MAISEQYIRELTARNDIVDVISRNVNLKRAGRLYKGLCPFHSERTPSFTVYPETQSFYCFGCGAAGDVIKFTMNINSLSFIESVRLLRQNSGMPLPDEDDGASNQKARILEMNKLAARWFHSQLNSDDGIPARKYLFERQLTSKTIVNFGLGYGGSPNDRFRLVNYLRSKGFSNEEISAAYLGRRGKNGGVIDIFSGRVMFPIIDLRGNVIAFGGRKLSDRQDGPKYLNSGDTPVFKKSNGLFALNFAKKSEKKTFILCEGYMDVIALHQAGFTNAVATLGTALTRQQTRLIGDYADKVILSYDSDEAGQKATKRAMGLFQNSDVRVQVLQMQGAKDPDEYIKKFGASRFELLIEGAASALDYTLLKIKNNYDISNPEQRIRYITKSCEVLADINSDIQRDVYAQRISQETGVDKASILNQTERIAGGRRRKNERKREAELINQGAARNIKVNYAAKGNTLSKVNAQQMIICAVLRDNTLYGYVRDNLSEEDFTDPDMKAAYIEIKKIIENGNPATYSALSYRIPETRADSIGRALGRTAELVITLRDVKQYTDNLINAKMSQTERSEKSLDEIARHLDSIKARKQ